MAVKFYGVFINLPTPAFAYSLAFYLLRERFRDEKRLIIKYDFYATKFGSLRQSRYHLKHCRE